MASPEIENRVTIHKERKLPSVWSLICLIDLRIEPLRSSNICICVRSWHGCLCLTLIILEICIYVDMDQDVGKGPASWRGLYRATLLWDLLMFIWRLYLCSNYMGKQCKLLCVSNYYVYTFDNYTYYMYRNVIKVAGLSLMVVNSFTWFFKRYVYPL